MPETLLDKRWIDRLLDILDSPAEIKRKRLQVLKDDFNMYYENKNITSAALDFYSCVLKELHKCG